MTIEKLLAELEPIIRFKAQKAHIPGLETEDIEQELRIEVWSKYQYFVNGKSSPKTFANLVFRRRIINLHHQMTNPNMNRNWLHLDQQVWGEEGGIEPQYPAEENLLKCWDWEVIERMAVAEAQATNANCVVS